MQAKAIRQAALELLGENSGGITWGELLRQITEQGYTRGAANHALRQFNNKDKRVDKPARGLYRHTKYKDQDIGDTSPARDISEDNFYQSFADWLVDDVEDATHAIPLGGNKFGGKWGTPDVIGKKESRQSDIVKGGTEIVSAEIKSDTSQLITAFGQACAYKLFSHKCYLVAPKDSPQVDIAKLDSLCQLFGIGLVFFNTENPDDPDYQIRTRPQKHEPDLFYTNEYMRKIEGDLWK